MSDTLHLDIALTLDGYALSAKADIPLSGITALEGASGSGKTTLLRAIAGLEARAKGVIRFGATDWLSEAGSVPPQDRRIGYVFQDTRLFKHLDVAQNLAYGHQRAGAAPEVLERVIKALDLSGLLARRIGALSGGETQRVAIGRALAMDPQLLLMDEPMSGLDQARKDEILPYIARAVQAMGCPAIYVSHERRETSMLADHMMRIKDGQLTGPIRCETTVPGVVREMAGGQLVLFVGDQPSRIPAQGAAGARCDVRMNEAGVVLCKQDPGASTALISLPATVASISQDQPGTYRLVLEGAGGRIVIYRTAAECEALQLQAGQAVWVNAADAWATIHEGVQEG